MTVAGMRLSAKPPISCMCRFSHGRPERAATEAIAARASCRKPAPYDQVTILERKLVSGCRPKRVRSLFGRMDGSNRTIGRAIIACAICKCVQYYVYLLSSRLVLEAMPDIRLPINL